MMKNYILLLLTITFSAISYSQTCPPLAAVGQNPAADKVLFLSQTLDLDCAAIPQIVDIDGSTFTQTKCVAGSTNRATYDLTSGSPIADINNFTVTWDLSLMIPAQTGTLVCTYINSVLGNDSFDIENAISISPNPVINKDHFNIQLKNNMSGSYTLYNTLGKTIVSNKINNTDFVKVNTSNLSQGIYILNIQVDGKSMTRKIIIDN